MDLWTVASYAGMICLLVAYQRNHAGAWNASSRPYLLLNAVGAGLLAAYSVVIRQWAFVILEGFWAWIALADLSGIARKRPAA